MQALDKISFSNNWITILFVFLLLLIAILKGMNQQKLFGYTRAFFIKGFIVQKTTERTSFFSVFNLIIFFLSSIVLAITLTFFVEFFLEYSVSFLFFTKLYGFVLVYLIAIFLVRKSIGVLFEIQSEVNYLYTTIVAYLYNTSLLLFPILIVVNYSIVSTYFLFWSFVLLFILSALLLLVNNKNLIISKLFYFILYLCALEIAPLLIIYKITVK